MTRPERLASIVDAFAAQRVLVVGDVIADEFVYGEIARVSREAPVMILRYESTETVPGGAGNAASNVASLGAPVTLVGAVGRDRPGRATMLELRRRGVDTGGLASVRGRATPTKTRLLAGLAHSLRQQVIRIDNEPSRTASDELAGKTAEALRSKAGSVDIVLVSDYDYGVVDATVTAALREAFLDRGTPVVVDSRFRLREFAGFTSATPNEVELEAVVGRRLDTQDAVVAEARGLAESLGLSSLLVTRGSRGLVVVEADGPATAFPIVGNAAAIDVTGAGDTVMATYSLALASGATCAEAADLANHAGGLVVMKRGTSTVTRDELRASLATERHE